MKIFILVLLTFLVSGFASAADSGLEVKPGTKVYVLTERLDENARAIGLTEDLIASKVELQLRRNGIPVGTQNDYAVSGAYLYVNIGVTKVAFSLRIDFNREVFYRVGNKQYTVSASTYSKGGTGTHNNNNRYVVDNLTDLIDQFSNDYIRTNQLPNLIKK